MELTKGSHSKHEVPQMQTLAFRIKFSSMVEEVDRSQQSEDVSEADLSL